MVGATPYLFRASLGHADSVAARFLRLVECFVSGSHEGFEGLPVPRRDGDTDAVVNAIRAAGFQAIPVALGADLDGA